MNPLRRYPVLATLLSPFRRSQQKTCAALVAALCQAAQASSFAIAGQLACLTQVQFGSALTRLYRFLRNERFDGWRLTEQLLCALARPDHSLLLALDGTKWQDRCSVLTASVCVGTRAIPVAAAACVKSQLARSPQPVGRDFPAPSRWVASAPQASAPSGSVIAGFIASPGWQSCCR